MNPTILLNGDEIYLEELVRENARLTVRLESEQQHRREMEATLARLKRENEDLSTRVEQADEDLSRAVAGVSREKELSSKLEQAIKDLHFVMANGDACQVCKNKCPMGTNDCKPLWKGL